VIEVYQQLFVEAGQRHMKTSAYSTQIVMASASVSVAAIALFITASASGALADTVCTTSGTELTCTGNQSGGIDVPGSITSLVVQDLTSDIAPGSGEGIFFQSTGAIEITSNTGEYIIDSVGDGIFAESTGDADDAAVMIEHSGNIVSSGGRGVFANGLRAVDVNVDGTVSAATGIFAQSTGDADSSTVHVDHTGNITATQGEGIHAFSARQTVTVLGSGNISAVNTAIYAESGGDSDTSTVTVNHQGGLTSTQNRGIFANSARQRVSVTNDGAITAYGDGILAQSLGDSDNATVTVMQAGNITSTTGYGILAYSPRQTVSVTATGDISSYQDGISAESRGNSESANVTVTHTGSISSVVGRGIYAYSTSRAVTVVNAGNISSSNDAIFAQSLGNSETADVSVTQTGDITSANGYGVFANSSNQSVSVIAAGNITSARDAIWAQSLGDANAASVTVSHTGNISVSSGKGIYANSARQATTVVNVGDISSTDDAIFARSLGNSDNADVSVTQTGDLRSTSGYGVYAYSSNQSVSVIATGNITSARDAIWAQSLGDANAASVTVSHTGDISVSSGKGIYANSARQATTVVNVGDISSTDDAIFARSLGNSDNADVSVTQTGDLRSTSGYGVYAYSSNQSVSVTAVGDITSLREGIWAGSSGDSDSATVTVNHTGNISVSSGKGIYASSARQAVTVVNSGDISSTSDGIFAQSSGSSDASDVSVSQAGNITSTSGYGIFAHSARQSVNLDVTGDITSSSDGIWAASGGDADSATVAITHVGNITSSFGRGIYANSPRQTVSVDNTGDISSQGDGIFAQSLGDSDQATVTVVQTGDVTSTTGKGVYAYSARQTVDVSVLGDIDASQYGVFAASEGDANSATVDILQVGNVTVDAGGIGLYAESARRKASITTNGDITGGNYGIKAISLSEDAEVSILGGSVSGASVAAVSAASITGASVTNRGEVDGGLGLAIEVSGASNSIDNYGTVSGSVIGVGGTTAFNNKEGSLLNAGINISLGGGDLNNDGVLGIGQVARAISTTTLNGDFVQSSTGLMRVDVDLDTGTSDLLDVSGNADLGGKVSIGIDVFGGSLPRDFTILTASTLGTQDLEIANVVVDGSIDYVNGTDVQLTVDAIDFAMGGVSGNGNALGDALTSAFESGSSELSSLFSALVDFTDADAYGEALAQLSPELAAAATMSAVNTNFQFTNKLMSCKTYTGADYVNREGECSWVTAEGFTLDYSPSNSSAAYDQKGYMLGTGFQTAVSDVWRAGLGVSYSRANTTGDTGNSSDSNQLAVGAVVKYDAGPLLLAADVTAGYVWSEAIRNVDFEGFSDRLSSDSDGKYLGSRLRAAYTSEMGHGYVRPLVDLDLTYYAHDGFTESGGAAALEVESGSELVATVSPALEVGGDFVGKNGLNYRPYMRAGAILNPDPETSLAASFAGAESGSGAFEITSETDGLLGTFAFGIDVITPGNGFGRLVYEGQLGENTESHSLAFKLGASF
jgi:uncharacterized protein with beta-barrel porin domain